VGTASGTRWDTVGHGTQEVDCAGQRLADRVRDLEGCNRNPKLPEFKIRDTVK
jgi:hypothetical protein